MTCREHDARIQAWRRAYHEALQHCRHWERGIWNAGPCCRAVILAEQQLKQAETMAHIVRALEAQGGGQ